MSAPQYLIMNSPSQAPPDSGCADHRYLCDPLTPIAGEMRGAALHVASLLTSSSGIQEPIISQGSREIGPVCRDNVHRERETCCQHEKSHPLRFTSGFSGRRMEKAEGWPDVA